MKNSVLDLLNDLRKAEVEAEQVEAALREANRPKGTACGTIQSKDLDSKGSEKTG